MEFAAELLERIVILCLKIIISGSGVRAAERSKGDPFGGCEFKRFLCGLVVFLFFRDADGHIALFVHHLLEVLGGNNTY